MAFRGLLLWWTGEERKSKLNNKIFILFIIRVKLSYVTYPSLVSTSPDHQGIPSYHFKCNISYGSLSRKINRALFVQCSQGSGGNHSMWGLPLPPLPLRQSKHTLPNLPQGRGAKKIIRYFNGCQIPFPNVLKGYRCYMWTSAHIGINVNFVTREIYCLPTPPRHPNLIGVFSQSAALRWFMQPAWLTAL